MQTVAEIYKTSIGPLGDGEKRELANLLLDDISNLKRKGTNGQANGNHGLEALFGSVSLGHPTGTDSEGIDEK